jgi:DNA polymerase III subunit beta
MEFRIQKSEFLKGLSLANGISDRKSTLPILANVLLRTDGKGTLLVGATDLTVSVSAELKAKVDREGALTVGARQLFEIVKALPAEELSLRAMENHWAEIKSGKSQFKLVGLPDRDFPKLPNHREVELAATEPRVLREMVTKTLFSVSTDETRYHLSGVLYESDGARVRMVSTDGHRLSLAERPLAGPKVSPGVMIPRKGLQELLRALEASEVGCELGFAQGHVFAKLGSVILSAKLIDAQFPPYDKVVPSSSERVVAVERVALLDALNRIKLLSSDKTWGIKLKLEPQLLELSSDNPDLGLAREELEVEFAGTPMAIGFNARYLIDVLTHLDDKEVELALNGELDPGVVRPRGSTEYLAVVMPMRI